MTRPQTLPVIAGALLASTALASTPSATKPRHTVQFSDYVEQAKQAQAAGRAEDAITSYERALRKARRADAGAATLANVLNGLGMLYQAEGRFEDAEAAYSRALKTAKAARATAFMATVKNNLGSLYIDMGFYHKATRRFEEALALNAASTSPDSVEASVLNNMGRLAQLRGHASEAEVRYRQALSRGRTGQQVAALNNLATLQREQDDLDAAAQSIAQALVMSQAAYGDTHTVTLQLKNNRAIIELERGSFSEAQALARNVIENSENDRNRETFERNQEIVRQESGRVAGRLEQITVIP